jgi:hypothetical protein
MPVCLRVVAATWVRSRLSPCLSHPTAFSHTRLQSCP